MKVFCNFVSPLLMRSFIILQEEKVKLFVATDEKYNVVIAQGNHLITTIIKLKESEC